jgi:hypothetical protein
MAFFGRHLRRLLGDVVEQRQQRGVLVTRRRLAERQDAADVLDHAQFRSRRDDAMIPGTARPF